MEYYYGWLALARQNFLNVVDVYAHTSLSGFLFPDIILQFKEKYSDLNINYTTVSCPEIYLSHDSRKPVLALAICEKANNGKYTKIWAGGLSLIHIYQVVRQGENKRARAACREIRQSCAGR